MIVLLEYLTTPNTFSLVANYALRLPIMLLSSAPKSSLLCSKLCSANLVGAGKFNVFKLEFCTHS